MRYARLLVLVFLVSCAAIPPDFLFFMPLIEKGPAKTTPKKGASLGIADCIAIEDLGLSWYYAGRSCEGVERIPYLDKPYKLTEAVTEPPLDAKHVMFLNECDNPYWRCPSVEEQVASFVALEDAWSAANIIWVGPCAAEDPQYLREFWVEYVRQVGYPPDPATHRLCIHCYNLAEVCIERVEKALAAGAWLGTIWVTEFGFVPGWDYTYRQVRNENAAFVRWMEGDARVERYAYWAAKFHFGDNVPARPGTGWVPLRFDYHNANGTITETNTDMGDWYAEVGE